MKDYFRNSSGNWFEQLDERRSRRASPRKAATLDELLQLGKKTKSAQDAGRRASRRYQEKMRREQPMLKLLHTARFAAKRQKVPFNLTLADVRIPVQCKYLGFELTNAVGKGRVQTNAVIDRIDRSRGYEPNNIQIISELASRMKRHATPEDLVVFAFNILRIHKKLAAQLEAEGV